MHTIRDVQFAIRSLTRSPGFTTVVVLTLALGIGASTAIFSVVNAVVLRPLDYPEPQQLVRITSELRGFGATDTGVAAAGAVRLSVAHRPLRRGRRGAADQRERDGRRHAGARRDDARELERTSPSSASRPRTGACSGREDDVPGVANVAVVSDGFWRRRLNADPQAIGRTIVIDADPVMVVGVMPPGFRHPGRTLQNDVESGARPAFAAPPRRTLSRSRRRLAGCLARLQPGVTLEQAQARLAEYGAAVSQQFPSDYPTQNGWRPLVMSAAGRCRRRRVDAMFMLLGGVGLLLLVACVNVAHLVLARSAGRRQEIAIRQALGARAGQLTWQLATESALLAAAGGALGLLVASWGLSGLVALAPGRVPRIESVTIDLTAVLVAGGDLVRRHGDVRPRPRVATDARRHVRGGERRRTGTQHRRPRRPRARRPRRRRSRDGDRAAHRRGSPRPKHRRAR